MNSWWMNGLPCAGGPHSAGVTSGTAETSSSATAEEALQQLRKSVDRCKDSTAATVFPNEENTHE